MELKEPIDSSAIEELPEFLEEDQTKTDESKLKSGRWTKQEHFLFLEGLKLYGKDWPKI
jgi:hypothetical protein